MARHQPATRRPYALLAACVAGGAVLGAGITYLLMRSAAEYAIFQQDTITREGGYSFINPLLSCDIAEDQPFVGFAPLQKKLQETAADAIASGKARRVSVYVRDMNKGLWTGVRPGDSFIPASLMKVPIMIAYLKKAQDDPALLKARVALTVDHDQNADEYFKPGHPLALGRVYTNSDLIAAMIESSDNNALAVLKARLSSDTINDVYDNFGVEGAASEDVDYMSPQEYMRLFRILYNASYLSHGYSQQALQLLAQTEYAGGLTRAVPSSVPVSHKFGERTVSSVDGHTLVKRELSDCGIVYYPQHPYGICVMTEGTDFTSLEDVIGEMSSVVYQNADSMFAAER